jgi:hypothetical protein
MKNQQAVVGVKPHWQWHQLVIGCQLMPLGCFPALERFAASFWLATVASLESAHHCTL